jgi:tellurite methyltransferase
VSQEEKTKWNRAYLEKRSHPHFEGDRSVAVDWAESLLPASAMTLDLGCGLLRNSFELAQQGHRVMAIDVAIEAFRHVAAWPETLQPVVMDVDRWSIPVDSFDLVIMVHYLNRAKLASLAASIRPGGYLALEIRVAPDQEAGQESPPFRLLPGEARTLFPKLQIEKEENFFRGETKCTRALLHRPLDQ